MTITPGIPDDWADTVEPERAEAFVGRLPADLGYNLRHYEQRVKAPGQGGDLLLTRGERVEVQWPNGNRLLRYVDEGGYQVNARHVGSATPFPWDGGRIVRVLTEDKPTSTDTADAAYLSGPMTGLPDFNRPAFHAAAAALRAQGHVVINPAEVDLGPDASWADYMRIHLAEIARRVTQVFVLPGWESSRGAQLEVHVARSLGLPVVPVPAPVDPDAEALDQMAQAMANRDGITAADEWVPWAAVALDALRETHDVTPRAEQ